MMVQILREHIPGNPRTNGTGKLTTITVHQTGNTSKGANARAHAKLQARGGMPRNSWHATVDDKEAIESYPDNARTWHAGQAAGNNTSYSVELCVNADGDYLAMLRNAAEFIASKSRDLGLKPSSATIVQHHHWSGKNCPKEIRAGKGGVTWARFLTMVQEAYAGTRPGIPVTTEEDDMPTAAEVAKAVLSEPIEVHGGEGRKTTLRQVLAWSDSHIVATRQVVRDVVAAAVPAIVSSILTTPIPRRGSATGNTNLAALIAWHDDGTIRLLDAAGQHGGGSGVEVDLDAITTSITTAARDAIDDALRGVEVTLTTKG